MKRTVSLLLAIFTLFSLLMLTSCDSEPTVEPPQTAVTEITCPACAQKNNDQSAFCSNCGALLKPSGTGIGGNGNNNGENNNSENNGGGESGKLTISLCAPLTGAAATYGIAVKNGAQLAVQKINAAGGLKNGLTLELLTYDDCFDPTKIAGCYADMLLKGTQLSLGCVTAACCREFAMLSHQDNLFFMTPTASADSVITYDNAYQMCYSDNNQGKAAADYVNALATQEELGKLGILYNVSDAYSVGLYDQFVANLDKQVTGEPVVATFVGDGSEAVFDTQIAHLADCKFIFMPIYYTPASRFMTQAKDIIAADAVYYGCDGFDGIDSFATDFDINQIPQTIAMLSQFDPHATTGAAGAFIENYTAIYEEAPHQFAAYGYDTVCALVGAMNAAIDAGKRIKSSTSASELCEILKAQFQGDYEYESAITASGSVVWDENGAADKKALLLVIKQAD